MMLATAFVTIGFELIVFGLATAPAASFESSDHSVEALEVCAFVCLLIAFIVLMFMQYGELKGKRIAAGVVIGGSFLGGMFLIFFSFFCATSRSGSGDRTNAPFSNQDLGRLVIHLLSRS